MGLAEQMADAITFDRTATPPTISEMRTAGFPRMTADGFIEMKPKPDAAGHEAEVAKERAALTAALDAYLAAFAVSPKPGTCIRCSAPLGGMFGAFEWGLAHGEGFCGRCKYPGRAIHYVNLGEEYGELTVRTIVQYHPDDVTTPEERALAKAEG
jgi:hypothetical protein